LRLLWVQLGRRWEHAGAAIDGLNVAEEPDVVEPFTVGGEGDRALEHR